MKLARPESGAWIAPNVVTAKREQSVTQYPGLVHLDAPIAGVERSVKRVLNYFLHSFIVTVHIFAEKDECLVSENLRSKKCAPNAIAISDFDRCGEPIVRCECLSGFRGDGYKQCIGWCIM